MIQKKLITPVILAGGSGTRLWPLSRKEKPKQFLEIFNNYSLLQLTALRCNDKIFSEPIIIVGEDHRFIVAEQLKKIGLKKSHIILEPQPKNTTAAITIAALFSQINRICENLLILPSDHYIKNNNQFIKLIKKTIRNPINDKLICFGIKPLGPETKYGYIIPNNNEKKLFKTVKKFEEKPTLTKAKNLIKKKALWNSGIFLFSANSILNEINKFFPKTSNYIRKSINNGKKDLDFIRLNEEYFNKVKNISIDYGVFEKTNKAVVINTNLFWNDLGTYNSLWEISKKDSKNNVLKGDIITNDVNNSYIHSENKLVVVSNINNLNVIVTNDAVLVTPIKKSNEIKYLVETLNKKKRNELIEHPITYRPWGFFQNINSSITHKIKKLTVLPYKKLSLQKHSKRSEHWIVIKGKATVTKGTNIFELKENESTFIPVNKKHRLENKGKKPLVIIEVQTGSYFGEDDIIRFKDIYGRIK